MKNPEPIPDRIRLLRRNSLFLYRAWWTMHYLVGIIGVFAGGLAGAAASNPELRKWAWISGSVAAFSTSLVTFLGPLQRAQRYWETFHSIDQDCSEYECSMIDVQTLLHRSRQARKLLLGNSGSRDVEEGVAKD
jgi:hypothetical protein